MSDDLPTHEVGFSGDPGAKARTAVGHVNAPLMVPTWPYPRQPNVQGPRCRMGRSRPNASRCAVIGAQAAARFAAFHAQIVIVRGLDGEAGEHDIAVGRTLVTAIFAEGEGQIEVGSDGIGLMAEHFLKGDDVGVDFAENAGDARRAFAAVHATALVNVVGDDAKGGHS